MNHQIRKLLPICLGLAIILVPSLNAESTTSEKSETPDPSEDQPSIEVVFAIDTTGSMSNLIRGAKKKVWSIVNEMASGDPTPDIRVGLVAYRDRGDDYVTQVHRLEQNLDGMYNTLMNFQADGGGDTPEHVNRALHDAVHKIKWSTDEDTLRILYLVGDCPPHMDYDNDVKYLETCKQAVKKNLIINTILAGNNREAAKHWKKIARRGEGKFLNVKHSGGMQTVETPYDEKLKKLGRKLDRTVLQYGDQRERKTGKKKKTKARKASEDSSSGTAASRTEWNARQVAKNEKLAKNDLVHRYRNDPSSIDDIPKKHLPEPMQKMTLEERKEHLQKVLEKQKKIQNKISSLTEKRKQYIKKQQKEKAKDRDSFDHQVLQTLKKQAKRVGIKYENK